MSDAIQLPIVDLSSPDRFSAANFIRQACVDHGFFYLVNHGVDEDLVKKVFEQSSNFFALPIEEKMKLARKNHRGYTALYAEKLDTTSLSSKGDFKLKLITFDCLESFYIGDPKESFYIGPLYDDLNQWPLEEDMPSWRSTMETYHQKVLSAVTKLLSLIALSLKLEEDFFEKIGALNEPLSIIGLLHYPGDHLNSSNEEICGASAHSDFGMITLLATDGVPGLQICREKSEQLQVWEDVPSMSGSVLHRVLQPEQERYSVAFFANPSKDCVIECLESCCSESCPPRFPPIKYLDYMEEKLRLAYGV